MTRRPDLHHIRDPRRLAIVLAERDAQFAREVILLHAPFGAVLLERAFQHPQRTDAALRRDLERQALLTGHERHDAARRDGLAHRLQRRDAEGEAHRAQPDGFQRPLQARDVVARDGDDRRGALAVRRADERLREHQRLRRVGETALRLHRQQR